MKVLLCIGYYNILLPDETGLTQIMKIMASGVAVEDHLYEGEIVLKKEELIKVEMKMVPPSTRFIRDGQPVTVEQPGRKVRRHPTTAGQKQLGY